MRTFIGLILHLLGKIRYPIHLCCNMTCIESRPDAFSFKIVQRFTEYLFQVVEYSDIE